MAWKKKGWQLFGVDTDGRDGWSWSFNAPEGYGYYEFISVATDRAGNKENKDNAFKENLEEAKCRVAKNVLKVAVVLAKPSDVENFEPIEEMVTTAKILPRYFDEVSYGALAIIPPELITDDGGWFRLSQGWRYYGTKEWWQFWLHDRTKEFGEEAIRVAGVPRGIYYIIIVVFAGPSEQWGEAIEGFRPIGDRMLEVYFGATEATRHLIAVSEFSNPIYNRWQEDMTWAHEIGHALGLPDLYPTGERWWWPWDFVGNIDDWGLMGTRNKVHLSSWSKERLGWLKYEDFTSTLRWVKSLPNLGYGSTVLRRWTDGWFDDEYFVFEVRSPDARYSAWDRLMPICWDHAGGLVLYKHHDPWIGDSSLNVVSNPNTGRRYFLPGEEYWLAPPFTHWLLPDHPGVLLSVLESKATEDAYEMRTHVREAWCWENRITARLAPFPQWRFSLGLAAPQLENYPWPDLDLHAYTVDGKHVGMNYLTSEYEIQIPGAIASGEFYNSSEWISVPDSVEVFFIVSSRDVASFLENRPMGLGLENENGFYALTLWYFDENMVGSGSDAENQVIRPGAEAFHVFQVLRVDNVYSVEVRPGMDLMSLEAWHAAIDNIPNNLFVNNPKQRKNTLKNKFGAVFNMLCENDYEEAIGKLMDDILKKLNADGKADWVRQPVLVQETKALVAKLRHDLRLMS